MRMSSPVIELELAAVESEHELHTILAERLGFPDYYGRNWDAFWDCIGDLEHSSTPMVLRVKGWDQLHRRLPNDANLLKACLRDLAAVRPDIAVEWISV